LSFILRLEDFVEHSLSYELGPFGSHDLGLECIRAAKSSPYFKRRALFKPEICCGEFPLRPVFDQVSLLPFVMGLHPIRFLVVPRCIALAVMLPCLTVISDVTGMIGGFLVGTLGVGINPYLYLAKNFDALVLKDVNSGLAKSFIFAILVALVSCHQGLSVEGGAEGVGKATTQAVVISIVLIIVVDCLATAVFYYAIPS